MSRRVELQWQRAYVALTISNGWAQRRRTATTAVRDTVSADKREALKVTGPAFRRIIRLLLPSGACRYAATCAL